jgi:tRNA A-37 threonylcarbamoyl transferase component Bud32
MMCLLEVHADERDALAQVGLTSAADFLQLEGVIQGGHPGRHVLRLNVGGVPCYLKKEHRVAWRDRLGHWWRGHGYVSKSTREGRLLARLEAAGIDCPRALAHGEADGRAFLLLREETDLTELRNYLQAYPLERLSLAEALGRELARVHAAGFQHRDLYSKHVLVGRKPAGWRFCFVDWQRGRQRRRLTWRQKLRDLATLDATLAESIAGRRERLLCWRAYLAAQAPLVGRPGKLIRILCRLSARLQRRRRIRELRQLPIAPDRQGLIWLDGEALIVTPLLEEQTGPIDAAVEWLKAPAGSPATTRVERMEMRTENQASWQLVRRWSDRPWRWLVFWWRKPLFPAPEFAQAASIIRLERYGVEAPRLLALGHRRFKPWQKYSFLLTQPPAGAVALRAYLATAPLAQRRHVLREAGRVLRRVHEAGYADGRQLSAWAVRPETGTVVLTSVDGLRRSPGSLDRLARADLARLRRTTDLSSADLLRFFLGYHDADKLNRPMHQLARRLSGGRRPQQPAARERRVA